MSILLFVCFQLRRERIAERMKALQELVPNSNRLDKSSMLDDIIDYVKFLQLQAKVRAEGEKKEPMALNHLLNVMLDRISKRM